MVLKLTPFFQNKVGQCSGIDLTNVVFSAYVRRPPYMQMGQFSVWVLQVRVQPVSHFFNAIRVITTSHLRHLCLYFRGNFRVDKHLLDTTFLSGNWVLSLLMAAPLICTIVGQTCVFWWRWWCSWWNKSRQSYHLLSLQGFFSCKSSKGVPTILKPNSIVELLDTLTTITWLLFLHLISSGTGSTFT